MGEEIRRSSTTQGIPSCALTFCSAIAADSHGNLFIADAYNHRIRMMTPDGTVTTIAGTGVMGHRDGPALQAQLGLCYGIAVGSDGSIFVSDWSNDVIHKLHNTFVSTLAGKPGESGFKDG